MLEAIKQVVENYLNYKNLGDVIFGVMETPTTVRLETGIVIGDPFLVIPERMTKHKVKIQGSEQEIDPELKAGEKVILIKALGGQRYVLFDRYGKEE